MTDDKREKGAKQAVQIVQDLSEPAHVAADLRHAMPDFQIRWMHEAGHCFSPEELQAQVDGYLVGDLPGLLTKDS